MLRRMAGWSSGVPAASRWKAKRSFSAWLMAAVDCWSTCCTNRHSHFRWSQMVQLNSAVRSRMTPWSVMPWYSSSGSSSGGSSQDAASATRARLTLSDLTSCASGSDCRNSSSTASCLAAREASVEVLPQIGHHGRLGVRDAPFQAFQQFRGGVCTSTSGCGRPAPTACPAARARAQTTLRLRSLWRCRGRGAWQASGRGSCVQIYRLKLNASTTDRPGDTATCR